MYQILKLFLFLKLNLHENLKQSIREHKFLGITRFVKIYILKVFAELKLQTWIKAAYYFTAVIEAMTNHIKHFKDA